MSARAMLPRLLHQVGRVQPWCVQRLCGSRPLHRTYFCRRNLPVWSGRSPFWALDTFMERQMAEMERGMNVMMGRGMNVMMGRSSLSPWFRTPGFVKTDGKEVQVKYDDQVFELTLNVDQYTPGELDARITGDHLEITGKQQDKQDQHGTVSRHFTRIFTIPQDVDAESIGSLLTSDGHLVIKGQVKKAAQAEARTINIEKEAPKEEFPKQ